jgi:hypothetical protein
MVAWKVRSTRYVDTMQRVAQSGNGIEGRWHATGKAVVAAAAGAAGAAAVVGLFGAGFLAVPLIVAAAVIAGVWAFADAREKALREREAQPTSRQARERGARGTGGQARDRGLGVGVCTVAEVQIQEIGVDPVDPRVLGRALQREGDQLPYITRGDLDGQLREHLAQARSGGGPTLVCLCGPPKAGKSRSMLQALKAELPDAAIVAPDPERENLQAILDSDLLQQAAGERGGVVVLWLDDLEGFVRVGNSGLDGTTLAKLKEQLPGLVVAATTGRRGHITRTADGLDMPREPLDDLLDHGVTEDLDPALATATEGDALAAVVPPDLAAEMHGGLGAVAAFGQRP